MAEVGKATFTALARFEDLRGQAQGAADDLRGLKGAAEETGTSIKSSTDRLEGLANGMSSAGKWMTTRVTAPIVGFAASVMASGGSYNTLLQRTGSAFETLLGSATEADKMMTNLGDFTKESPFPRQMFIEATQQLLGFGVDAESIIPILSSVQDAVAAMGGGESDIQELVGVMARVQSQGKMTASEIEMFGRRGIDALALMATAAGVTKDEMREMYSSMSAEESLDLLTRGMQERFAGAAAGVKETWTGTMDRIKAAFRDFSSTLMTPFIDPKGGGLFIEWGNKLADGMRVVERAVGKIPPGLILLGAGFITLVAAAGPMLMIVGSMITAFLKVQTAIAAIKTAVAVGQLGMLGTAAGGMMTGLSGIASFLLGPWGLALLAAGAAIYGLARWLQSTETELITTAEAAETLAGSVEGLEFGEVADGLSAYAGAAAEARSEVIEFTTANAEVISQLKEMSGEGGGAFLLQMGLRLVMRGNDPEVVAEQLERLRIEAGIPIEFAVDASDLTDATVIAESFVVSARGVADLASDGSFSAWLYDVSNASKDAAEDLGSLAGEMMLTGDVVGSLGGLDAYITELQTLGMESGEVATLTEAFLAGLAETSGIAFDAAAGVDGFAGVLQAMAGGLEGLPADLETAARMAMFLAETTGEELTPELFEAQLALIETRNAARDAGGAVGELDAIFGDTIPSAHDLAQAVGDGALTMEEAAVYAGELGISSDELGGAFEELGIDVRDTTEILQEYLDTVRAAEDPVFALDKALRDMTKAEQEYQEALTEHGPKSEEAQLAAMNLMGAISGLEAAALSGELSFEAFASRLDHMVERGWITEEMAGILKDRVAELTDKAEDFHGDYEATLIADDRQSSRAIADHIAALARIPRRITTQLEIQAAMGGSLSGDQRSMPAPKATYEPVRVRSGAMHSGGEVGRGKSQHGEVTALLERGEGILSVKAMANLTAQAGGGGSSGVSGGTGRGGFTVQGDLVVNNPVGQTTEKSLLGAVERMSLLGGA